MMMQHLIVVSLLVCAAYAQASCQYAVPQAPVLIYPANNSVLEVGETMFWAPADLPAGCVYYSNNGDFPFKAWHYSILITPGYQYYQLLNSSFPILGNGIPWNKPFYSTTDRSIAPGTTYSWQVIVYNDTTIAGWSPIQYFTTAGPSTQFYLTPLSNGVTVIDRIYPPIVDSQWGYKFYVMNITSPGGSLFVTAASSTLPIPNAPARGHVDFFISQTNMFPVSKSATGDVGSAGTCDPLDVTNTAPCPATVSERQYATVSSVTSSFVYIGVRAVNSYATYSLTATYSCAGTASLDALTTTSCSTCPKNAVSVGIATACQCRRGYYAPSANNITAGCLVCPVGGICDGTSTPVPARGYWAAQSSTTSGLVYYRCPNKNACLGGFSSLCATGYSGRLCAQCATGYYLLGANCYSCPSGAQAQVAIGVILLLLFLLVCYELARFFRKISSLTVVVSFVQTLAILPLFRGLEWPQYIRVFFNDCSGFNLNVQLIGAECVTSTGWINLWMYSLFLPLVVFGIFVLAFFVQFFIRFCQKGDKRWTIRDILNKCIPAFITFCLFFYIQITYSSLQYFNCTLQPDGSYTLDASADIICYSDTWLKYLGVAIYGIFVWVLGIPAGLLIWMIIRKHKLYDISVKGDEMYKWLGPVYLRYKAEFYWWEFMNFLRKVGILVVGAYLGAYPLFQACVVIAILGLAMLLLMAVQPYEYKHSNWLESLLFFVLILIFLAGILFESGTLPTSIQYAQAIFSLLVIFLAVALGASGVVFILELRQVNQKVSEEDIKVMHEKLAKHELHYLHSQRVLQHARPVPKLKDGGGSSVPSEEEASRELSREASREDSEPVEES